MPLQVCLCERVCSLLSFLLPRVWHQQQRIRKSSLAFCFCGHLTASALLPRPLFSMPLASFPSALVLMLRVCEHSRLQFHHEFSAGPGEAAATLPTIHNALKASALDSCAVLPRPALCPAALGVFLHTHVRSMHSKLLVVSAMRSYNQYATTIKLLKDARYFLPVRLLRPLLFASAHVCSKSLMSVGGQPGRPGGCEANSKAFFAISSCCSVATSPALLCPCESPRPSK